MQSAKGYGGLKVYGRSKLANILFTRELARRLAGTGVTANCLHPGVVKTRFGESSGGFAGLLIPFIRPFFITADKGADTVVYLASSPEVANNTTGGYFVKRKLDRTVRGGEGRRGGEAALDREREAGECSWRIKLAQCALADYDLILRSPQSGRLEG